MDTSEAIAARVDELVAGDETSGRDDAESLVDELQDDDISVIEDWARAALLALPTPLRPYGHAELERRRAVLIRVAAEAAARLDRPGRDHMAAVLARYVLGKADCPERSRIEAALESISSPPDGWHDAVLAFAAAPSLDAWEQLMQFTPDDVFYHRERHALQMLLGLGVDGDTLFRCATRCGAPPEALELVERGQVAPETVVHRGREGPAEARGLWLGLAARAALVRGDRFRTVRLLKEAVETASPGFPPLTEVWAVRELADDSLNEMLDKAGIPR